MSDDDETIPYSIRGVPTSGNDDSTREPRIEHNRRHYKPGIDLNRREMVCNQRKRQFRRHLKVKCVFYAEISVGGQLVP